MVGLVCFCEPGMFVAVSAMASTLSHNALNLDGTDLEHLISSSCLIRLYLAFAASSLVAPAILHKMGPRWTVTAGTWGSAPSAPPIQRVHSPSLTCCGLTGTGSWCVRCTCTAGAWRRAGWSTHRPSRSAAALVRFSNRVVHPPP